MILYLYVKTHNTTGLKYFGKTYRKDPSKYSGSGVYWKAHLKKHGNDVTTEIVGTFENLEEATQFALKFSKENDIVNSPLWANLIDENAIDGYELGHKPYYEWTKERREDQAKRIKELWTDPEYRQRVLASRSSTCRARLDTLSPDVKEKRLKDRERSGRWKRGEPISKDSYRYKKPPEFGQKVSIALKGRAKTAEHRKHLSEAKAGKRVRSRKIQPVRDHLGLWFDNPRRFSQHYNLASPCNFFNDLDKPIYVRSMYKKLGIPFTEENRARTKRELGFDVKGSSE